MDTVTRKRAWCVLSMVAALAVFVAVAVLMVSTGMAPGVAIAAMIAVGSGSAYAFYQAWPRERRRSVR